MAKLWFDVRNEADSDVAEILIYDVIGRPSLTEPKVGAKAFAQALQDIPTDRAIRVRINSPGGSVADGLAIYNLLQSRGEKVTTIVDGYALSVASIIALGGHKVHMPKNALMMIHDPSAEAEGNASEMRRAASMLDTHTEALATIYQKKSGKTIDEIKRLMSAETWFTGDEAKAAGFADTVTDEIEITASFDFSKFKNPPRIDSKPIIRTSIMNAQDFKNLIASALGITSAEQSEQIATLTAALASEKAANAAQAVKLATALDMQSSHAAALVEKEASVEARASAKAREIVASQGLPAPIPQGAGSTDPSNAGDVLAQFAGVKDPRKRTEFYRANKAAIDAAYAAQPNKTI